MYPEKCTQLVAAKEYFATLIFSSPRSPSWPLVKELCRQADGYVEFKGHYAVGFKATQESIQLLIAIADMVLTWKTVALFINRKKEFSLYSTKWIGCYLNALRCLDWKANCHKIVTCRNPLEGLSFTISIVIGIEEKPRLDVAPKKILVPCKCVWFNEYTYKDHPSELKSIYQASAVEGGFFDCPMFNIDYFEELN